MKILILFHAHCNDGKTAAAIVHAKYRSNEHEITVQGVLYNQPLPPIEAGLFHKIYVVDFAYHGDDLKLLCTKSKQIIMLDHHKTAIDKLNEHGGKFSSNLYLTLDMNRSGAMLAWDHCFPGTEYHPIVRDVGMRDLWVDDWKIKYPNALALHLALQTISMNEISLALFSDYTLNKCNESSGFYQKFVTQGKALVVYVDNLIDSHIANGQEIILNEKRVLAVNCPAQISSELSDKLKEDYDSAMCYFIEKENNVHLSFRSGYGAAKPLAEYFDGGGHANSAGADVDTCILLEILDGKHA